MNTGKKKKYHKRVSLLIYRLTAGSRQVAHIFSHILTVATGGKIRWFPLELYMVKQDKGSVPVPTLALLL